MKRNTQKNINYHNKESIKNRIGDAFSLVLGLFCKNDTVSGIMGNTQGVKRANIPPAKPRKNMPTSLHDLLHDLKTLSIF